MSYYTGSNTIAVVPERLLLATQSHALQDEDFQELVRHDIQIAVARKVRADAGTHRCLQQCVVAGRQFIEKTLAELDPSMLAVNSVRKGSPAEV